MGKSKETESFDEDWFAVLCMADEIRQDEPDFGLVLNDDPRKEFAVDVEVNVVEAASLSETEAERRIRGTDDRSRPCNEIPLGMTGRDFQIGRFGVTFASRRSISLGRAVRALARYFVDHHYDDPEVHGTDPIGLSAFRITRLDWSGEKGYWSVDLEIDEKVARATRFSWPPRKPRGDGALRRGFRDFQERFGFPVPSSMRAFFARRPILDHLLVPSWQSILDLKDLFPNIPPRFLPVLEVMNGDLFGLFVPGQGKPPFVAFFAHEESRVIPITSDLDAFFRDPDRFAPDGPYFRRKKWFPIGPDRAWRGLRVDPESADPERELLKPLLLHDEELGHEPGRLGSGQFPRDRSVEKLIARFPSGKDAVSRTIARRFRAVHDLRDRRRWLALARDLVRHRRQADALRALENGIFIHFLDPWYGEPGRNGAIGRLWKNILEFFAAMRPIAKAHGDDFDRASISHQLRNAREYAREESSKTRTRR